MSARLWWKFPELAILEKVCARFLDDSKMVPLDRREECLARLKAALPHRSHDGIVKQAVRQHLFAPSPTGGGNRVVGKPLSDDMTARRARVVKSDQRFREAMQAAGYAPTISN